MYWCAVSTPKSCCPRFSWQLYREGRSLAPSCWGRVAAVCVWTLKKQCYAYCGCKQRLYRSQKRADNESWVRNLANVSNCLNTVCNILLGCFPLNLGKFELTVFGLKFLHLLCSCMFEAYSLPGFSTPRCYLHCGVLKKLNFTDILSGSRLK